MLSLIVVKHDGREEHYNPDKVRNAVKKAAIASNYNEKDADWLGSRTAHGIVFAADTYDTVKVDTIHDAVEKYLMIHAPSVAKNYILYRQERTNHRERNSDLGRGIENLVNDASKDNANSENSMASKAHFIAEHVMKERELANMNPRYAKNHRDGRIYVHDLCYRSLSVNCFFSPLGKMLKEGFNNGTGFVRTPQRIATAGALASIILQSMQANFFGGEGFVNFDTDLAPYAEKEYEHQLKMVREIASYEDKGLILSGWTQELAMERTENAVYQAMEAFVFNANTQKARSGGQNVFSSVNLGTDVNPWAKMISRNLLKAFMAGMGHGETPFFPVICYRLKDGINLHKGEPNFDLTELAIQCVGKRIMPRFVIADSVLYKDWKNAARMGCRTNICTNVNGDESPESRGNLAFNTINLPMLALEAKEEGSDNLLHAFFDKLNGAVDDAIGELTERYKKMCGFKAKDFPFARYWYQGHENLEGDNSSMECCFKNGSLSVGFIGLAECLTVLTGKHHGESEDAQKIGLKIVKTIRDATDKMTKKRGLNYSCFATPAENCCFALMNALKKRFGEIKGVTDHDFLTNSFHVPVWAGVDAKTKIDVEGAYHPYCNAGAIFYLEAGRSPKWNPEGVLAVLQYVADKKEIGYMGINFATHHCHECHYNWDNDAVKCPKCGSSNVQTTAIITGYLADVSRWNAGKLAELSKRKVNL